MRVRLLTFIVALIALCVAASPALAAPKKSQVKFAQTTYSVPENGGTATVRIVRSGNLNATSTVQLSIDATSTATAGNYSITQPGALAPGSPVTVTFNPKDTAKDINVAITDNATVNAPNKKIVFKIGSPNANTQIKGAIATLTIVDNEGPGTLDFTSPTYSVVEGAGRATVTVTRVGASNLALSVDYATMAAPVGDPNPSATIGSDYTLTTGTLTFNAGEIVKTIQVPITDDQLAESSEDFQVSLTNAKNLSGGTAPQIGTNVPALVTINDDDISTYSFSSSLFSVNEDVASGHATITVNRGGATNIPSVVAYSTSNGTALVGADYTAAVGTLSFAAGQTSKTFDVPVTNDGTSEANETVNLTLTVNSLTVATSQLSIVDNDNPKGSAQFSDVSYNVNEDGTSATVTVMLSHAVDADVTVDYATSDGTATAGQDYTAASGTLTFVGNLNNAGAGQT